jgi:hypothetical protein
LAVIETDQAAVNPIIYAELGAVMVKMRAGSLPEVVSAADRPSDEDD